MQYLVAILTAIVFALFATLFVSSPIATWIVSRQTFDNPDDVANLHAIIFMAVNATALVIGFAIGMLASRRLGQDGDGAREG